MMLSSGGSIFGVLNNLKCWVDVEREEIMGEEACLYTSSRSRLTGSGHAPMV